MTALVLTVRVVWLAAGLLFLALLGWTKPREDWQPDQMSVGWRKGHP